jgi:hypothetical protein
MNENHQNIDVLLHLRGKMLKTFGKAERKHSTRSVEGDEI